MKTSLHDRLARVAASEEVARRKPGAWLLRSPAWAFALALHLLAAVVLMNIVHFTARPGSSQVFRISFAPPFKPAPQAPGGAQQGDQDNGVNGKDSEDSAAAGPVDEKDPSPSGAHSDLPPAPALALQAPGGLKLPGNGVSGLNGPGGIFKGRGGAGRGEALRKNGGDESTEAAVDAGLAWLARHQSQDGGWGGTCERCGDNGSWYRAAVTGLAMLAFLAHGTTDADTTEPFSKVVAKARKFLLDCQVKEGTFLNDKVNPLPCMYTHGIATFALAELLAMTQDPALRDPVTRAIRASVEAQQPTGGWDYNDRITGRTDLSVSTWHVQAFRAARLAGIPVPRASWSSLRNLYSRAAQPMTYTFPYEVRRGQTPATGFPGVTAAGAVASFYLELPEDQTFMKGLADDLLSRCPVYGERRPDDKVDRSWGDGKGSQYFTYYATLMLFHSGGDRWARWNARLKPALLAAQEKAGCAKGSWNPEATDASYIGRAFATTMATLDLEVYYRYLKSTDNIGDQLCELVDMKAATDADLLKALQAADEPDRSAAAREIARRGKPGAQEALLDAARRASGIERARLLDLLSSFPDSDALEDAILAIVSEDRDETVRSAGSDALREITGANLTTVAQWKSWVANRKNRVKREPAEEK